ncbi:MAG: methylmalonyl Co-A mutase-associated GTPase MeaB [Ferruginibacter sp.]|nr:methylmalonyl Co-A mutase-associated GTPase MeaB [Ferruginibacter sp.]
MWQDVLQKIKNGDYKSLARVISLVENEATGYLDLLEQIPPSSVPIIGITGPPGAGKSTLVNELIELLVKRNKKIGVICVDPSSPFNLGALLGDRIRLSEWYNNPNVFIRSLATRGSLGGLNPKIIEICDVLKAGVFDYIIIETVGVGQSEIEIVGLADCTVVVLVPEAGDEIQTMKAGLMEIADIFVVNKADRPDANSFTNNLRQMLAPAFKNHSANLPIIETVATQKKGVDDFLAAIEFNLQNLKKENNNKNWLLAQKAYQLIAQKRMKEISTKDLLEKITAEGNAFNLYQFIKKNY